MDSGCRLRRVRGGCSHYYAFEVCRLFVLWTARGTFRRPESDRFSVMLRFPHCRPTITIRPGSE